MNLQPDLCIPLLIAISALYGFFRGLVREAFSLLAWILAWWVARHGAAGVRHVLSPWIHTPSLRLAAAFLCLFVVTWLVATLIGYALQAFLGHIGLGWSDRWLGALFGVARGVLIAIVALILLSPYLHRDPWWKASPWVATLMHFAPEARSLGTRLQSFSRSAI